jgi:hypothetical protein
MIMVHAFLYQCDHHTTNKILTLISSQAMQVPKPCDNIIKYKPHNSVC